MTALTESYWPATADIELLQTSTVSILRAAAAAHGQRVALIDARAPHAARARITYAELLARAERCAHALARRCPPGSHVAVWGANCPEWVVAQFALALAGLVMVTVNPALGVHELGYVLRQSRARGVLHARQHRGMNLTPLLAAASVGLEFDFTLAFDELDAFAADSAPATALPCVRPADPCMIQYTSGTTGTPKGAHLNHFSVTNNARMMALLKGLNASTVNLAVAPLFHTAGCVANVLGMTQLGASLVLPQEFDAELMLDLIAEERVTYAFGVPTMLIAMLAAQARRARDVSSLEVVFSGATTVPIELVRQVEREFKVTLIIGYGQTETSPAITHTRLDDSARDKAETIGRPIPQVEVKIIDPGSGRIVAVDTAGELCTRGFLVMRGYHDNPDATAATIDADGWLHTGDLCSMDARGYCRITGRLKDMIIRGGENIYPREIEELLYTHAAIAEAAVFGVADDYFGEAVAAAITFKQGVSASGAELHDFVRAHLARFKVPSQWFALTAIPATASGKLQKFRLQELYRAGELEAARI